MKGCFTNKPVLNPNFSALAIASSVVPVLLVAFLKSIKSLFFSNLLLNG